MKATTRTVYLLLVLIFTGIMFTVSYQSKRVVVGGNSFSVATLTATATSTITGTVTSDDVVLNELMPNPSTGDGDPMPGGEWIEIYNPTDYDIDLSGWYLYDEANHGLPIIAGNTEDGVTTISSKGFLVVYRNGYNFSLNNDNDTVRLYDSQISLGNQIDSFHYTGTSVDKTWARVPDGAGSWLGGRNATKKGPNI